MHTVRLIGGPLDGRLEQVQWDNGYLEFPQMERPFIGFRAGGLPPAGEMTFRYAQYRRVQRANGDRPAVYEYVER